MVCMHINFPIKSLLRAERQWKTGNQWKVLGRCCLQQQLELIGEVLCHIECLSFAAGKQFRY